MNSKPAMKAHIPPSNGRTELFFEKAKEIPDNRIIIKPIIPAALAWAVEVFFPR